MDEKRVTFERRLAAECQIQAFEQIIAKSELAREIWRHKHAAEIEALNRQQAVIDWLAKSLKLEAS